MRHPIAVLGLTLELHDSRRPGLCLAKASFHLQGLSSHLGISSSKLQNCLAENTQTHRTAGVKPLLKHEPQAYKKIGPGQLMPSEVMCCGVIAEPQKVLRATFVCTAIYITVENTATRTTHAPSRTIKKNLCH